MTAKYGDNVKFKFVGRLDDGSVFDSTDGKPPIEAELGNSVLLPALQDALIDMDAGQVKFVKVQAADAYGLRKKGLIHSIERRKFPPDVDLVKGKQLNAAGKDGQPKIMTIAAVGDEIVTLDTNHPLAGQNLSFEITMVKVY